MPSNLTQLAGQFIGTMGEDSDERTERSGKREKLFIFDNYDNLLAVTSKYIEAVFKETVEVPKSLSITFPMEDPKAEYFQGGNQVAFRDLKGNFRLFTIREVDDEDDGDADKVVECLPSMQELTDVIIKEKVPQDKEAGHVLGIILKDSRWQVGEVAELGKNSTSFYFTNGYEALEKLIDTWGGELVDRIEIEGSKIAGRYIDIVNRKGKETGKRSEIGKDIENIRRSVLYYPKTALYGKGSSLEAEDEEGEKTGGYTRKITFRDVVWEKSNNDPVDKPKGQEYVGDEDAREKYGIYDPSTGKMLHRYGNFEDNDEEDSSKLLAKTWEAVQSEKEPKAEYEMTIVTFYGISGYEHEQVYLGDSVIARDTDVKPYILIDARITEWEYDIGDPDNGTVIMGNILELESSNDDLNWVVEKVKDNANNWDKGGDPVTDEKFPDIKPPVPTNVTADGLYQTVMLSWDFDPRVFIASYEVYASQIKGYTPSSETRVFRGKTGGYTHESDNNEKWYFHVRAVNTHGTPSDYSDEVEASTAKINFDDIEEDNIPNFIEYSVYTGETAPDPDDYKYWIDTSDKQLILYRWNEDLEDWEALAPTSPGDIGAVDIKEYQDKINDIVSDLEEKAGLEYVDGQFKETKEVIEGQSTDIDKNKEEIKSKANKTTVDDVEGKVSDNKSEIKQQAKLIEQRVKSTDYEKDKDGIVSDIESHDSRITQTEEDIKSTVDKTTYEADKDSFKKDISNNSSEIKQNAKSIKSKVEESQYKSDKDGMSEDIEENKSKIEQNAKSIKSKVNAKYVEGEIGKIEIGARNLIKNSQENMIISEDEGTGNPEYRRKNIYEKLNKDTIYTFSSNVKIVSGDADKITIRPYISEEKEMDFINLSIENGRVVGTFKTDDKARYDLLLYGGEAGNTSGNEVEFSHYKLEKGNKVSDWSPAPEDIEADIDNVREYSSEIEQTAKDIKSNVSSIEKSINGNKSSIEDNKSSIEQNAKSIKSKVSSSTHKTDIDKLQTNVSKAESEIKQNADEITSRIKKNGVISSINQTAEKITIDADRLNVKGDLNVVDGDLRIKNSVITNELVAGNAKIDAAKIADFSANKITSGTINTDKITIKGGGSKNYTRITGSFVESYGKHKRDWGKSNDTDTVRLKLENGQFRARNDDEGWSLYFNDKGIATYNNAVGDDNGSASGFIEFHARDYSPSLHHSGLTVGSIAGRLALQTSGSNIIINPKGGTVYVQDKTAIGSGEYYDLRADIFYARAIRQHPTGNWKGKHLYLGVSGSEDAEVRVTTLDLWKGGASYMPIHAGRLKADFTKVIEGKDGVDLRMKDGRFYSQSIYDKTYSGSSNVYVTSYGTLGRTTSASKYKLNIKDIDTEELPQKILNLTPKSWHDKASCEQYSKYLERVHMGEKLDIDDIDEEVPSIERHYGLQAEDLVDEGLEMYINYGKNKEIEGIEYDRLWTLLIPLVRKNKEYTEFLKGENNSLHERVAQLEKLMHEYLGGKE